MVRASEAPANSERWTRLAEPHEVGALSSNARLCHRSEPVFRHLFAPDARAKRASSQKRANGDERISPVGWDRQTPNCVQRSTMGPQRWVPGRCVAASGGTSAKQYRTTGRRPVLSRRRLSTGRRPFGPSPTSYTSTQRPNITGIGRGAIEPRQPHRSGKRKAKWR